MLQLCSIGCWLSSCVLSFGFKCFFLLLFRSVCRERNYSIVNEYRAFGSYSGGAFDSIRSVDATPERHDLFILCSFFILTANDGIPIWAYRLPRTTLKSPIITLQSCDDGFFLWWSSTTSSQFFRRFLLLLFVRLIRSFISLSVGSSSFVVDVVVVSRRCDRCNKPKAMLATPLTAFFFISSSTTAFIATVRIDPVARPV